jgi:hypothetical protein
MYFTVERRRSRKFLVHILQARYGMIQKQQQERPDTDKILIYLIKYAILLLLNNFAT